MTKEAKPLACAVCSALAMIAESGEGPDTAASVRAFCEDGEGYAFIVMLQEDPGFWKRLRLPYTEPDTQDANGTHPSSEVPKAVYRDLVLRLNKEREGA